jgi:hypothetical protein
VGGQARAQVEAIHLRAQDEKLAEDPQEIFPLLGLDCCEGLPLVLQLDQPLLYGHWDCGAHLLFKLSLGLLGLHPAIPQDVHASVASAQTFRL